jgi:hypothetical protein
MFVDPSGESFLGQQMAVMTSLSLVITQNTPILRQIFITSVRMLPSSYRLAQNLIRGGAIRAAGTHAHHIVAGSSAMAAKARVILIRYNVGINESANGVFLKASYHMRIHTARYYHEVEMLLANATSRNEVISVLENIRKMMLAGTFPY